MGLLDGQAGVSVCLALPAPKKHGARTVYRFWTGAYRLDPGWAFLAIIYIHICSR